MSKIARSVGGRFLIISYPVIHLVNKGHASVPHLGTVAEIDIRASDPLVVFVHELLRGVFYLIEVAVMRINLLVELPFHLVVPFPRLLLSLHPVEVLVADSPCLSGIMGQEVGDIRKREDITAVAFAGKGIQNR